MLGCIPGVHRWRRFKADFPLIWDEPPRIHGPRIRAIGGMPSFQRHTPATKRNSHAIYSWLLKKKCLNNPKKNNGALQQPMTLGRFVTMGQKSSEIMANLRSPAKKLISWLVNVDKPILKD